MKNRKGVFGGTAGLWLARKKRRTEPFSHNENSKSTNRMANIPNKEAIERTKLVKPSFMSPSLASTDSEDDSSIGSPKMTPVERHFHESLCKVKPRRKGIFASRKRIFVSSFIETPLDDSPSSKTASVSSDDGRSNPNSLSEPSPTSQKDTDDASSGLTNPFSSSDTLASKASTVSSVIDSVVVSQTSLSSKASASSASTNNNNSTVSNDDNLLSQESLESSVFDFDKHDAKFQNANQSSLNASSTTHSALDAARAFFAQIDADQSLLKVDDSSLLTEDKQHTHSYKATTTRRKLSKQTAKAEYRKYCQMCRGAAVQPLPKRKYLEQRHIYFRPNEIYEGMFDDF